MSTKKENNYTQIKGVLSTVSGTYNDMVITKKGVIYMKKLKVSKK
jgi:hypothetical protein